MYTYYLLWLYANFVFFFPQAIDNDRDNFGEVTYALVSADGTNLWVVYLTVPASLHNFFIASEYCMPSSIIPSINCLLYVLLNGISVYNAIFWCLPPTSHAYLLDICINMEFSPPLPVFLWVKQSVRSLSRLSWTERWGTHTTWL